MARHVPSGEIVVEQWVRDACAECEFYGKSWSCPPAIPELDETRKRILSYKHAIVVLFRHPKDRKGLEKAVLAIESELKSKGFSSTYGFFVSPCTACRDCSYPDECQKKTLCRPTGESWGIDLITTAKNAGIEIKIVEKGKDFEPVTVFLVE